MSSPINHFVKLDEFSKKALELPDITSLYESKTFDEVLQGERPFEEGHVKSYVYHDYERGKADMEYQDYLSYAYIKVKDEIDGHFIDNNVNKEVYVKGFNERISKVIYQLKVKSGINILKESLDNIDQRNSGNEYFEFNKAEIKRFIFLLNSWIRPLEILRNYVNKRLNSNTTNETPAVNSPETPPAPTNDLKSLFKDPNKYDSLIEFMVLEKNVVKRVEGKLIWKRRKYEISVLVEMLYYEEYLTKQVNNQDLSVRASNTFYNFSVSPRQLQNRSDAAVDRFNDLLRNFKSSLG